MKTKILLVLSCLFGFIIFCYMMVFAVDKTCERMQIFTEVCKKADISKPHITP